MDEIATASPGIATDATRYATSPWTPETIGVTKKYFALGYSLSEIAAEIFKATGLGVTRNSVVSWLHRNSMTRPAPRKERAKPAPKRERAKTRLPGFTKEEIRALEFPVEPIGPNAVSFLDTQSHHCRWIIGKWDDNIALCCGNEIAKDSSNPSRLSFCSHHCSFSYEKKTRRRSDPSQSFIFSSSAIRQGAGSATTGLGGGQLGAGRYTS